MQNATQRYSGQRTHVQIDRLLKQANTLKIITPFIDVYYAKMLAHLSLSKPLYLITSPMPHTDKRVKKILESGNRSRYLRAILYIVVLDILCAILGLHYILPAILIASGLLILLMVLLYRLAHSKIRLKIIGSRFVHEKIYLSEREAIVGSANLTYKGTHHNVEHIEVITDQNAVGELTKHFNELWRRGN